MNKNDEKLLEELKYKSSNFKKVHREQEKQRQSFLNDPANNEAVLIAKANMNVARKRIFRTR